MLLLNEHELKKQWVKSQDDRHRNKRRALQILLSGRLNLHSEFSLLVRLKFRNSKYGVSEEWERLRSIS